MTTKSVPFPPRPRARIAAALAALLLLSGCSGLKLGYAFAEDMLESRAKKYLELDTAQEIELRKHTEALVAWHRKTMLPRYAAYLNAQAEIVEAGGWDRAQLAAAFAGFRALLDETVAGAAPFIAEALMHHTTPAKTGYLKARMDETIAEYRKSEADETPDEAVAEWIERRVDRIERFTGALTEAQLAVIRRYAETEVDRSMRWIDNREKRQAAFLTLLRSKPTRERVAHFVHRVLLHAHEIVDPDYRAISEARWAVRERLYFDVLSIMTDAQRREVVETLRDYAKDIRELAGE